MAKEFTVTRIRTITLKEGYGVWFIPVYAGEDSPNPDAVVDVDAAIVRISPDTIVMLHGEPCIPIGNNCFIPAATFQEREELACDDTHDLRNRWFETEQEAREHMEYTLRRWKHPQPWESFVCIE